MKYPTTELRVIEDLAKYGMKMIEYAHVETTLPPTRTVLFTMTPDDAERLAYAIIDLVKLAKSNDGEAFV